jgi:twitching motility protein PilT
VTVDTHTFKDALRYILRQDPDVVLIGEMRDLETMAAALTIAETGHLTFGTLHTNTAAQTITRIIDMFPADQHDQVTVQLSFVIEGIISQHLLPKKNGGRCMASEVFIPTHGMRSLIREGKVEQIYPLMLTGQTKYGMQTMNQSLHDLYRRGDISMKEAIKESPLPKELKDMIEKGTPESASGSYQR